MSSTFGNVLHSKHLRPIALPRYRLLARWHPGGHRRGPGGAAGLPRPSRPRSRRDRDQTPRGRRRPHHRRCCRWTYHRRAHCRDYREHQHALQGLLRAALQAPSRTCRLPRAREVSQHARCCWWRAFLRPPNGTLVHRRWHRAAGTRGPWHSRSWRTSRRSAVSPTCRWTIWSIARPTARRSLRTICRALTPPQPAVCARRS